MDNQLLRASARPQTHQNTGRRGEGRGASGETEWDALGRGEDVWEVEKGVGLVLSEINGRKYRVRADLLLGTSVTANMRAVEAHLSQKLRSWISGEGAARQLSRRCCCLAVTMVDLFLGGGGTVQIQGLQMLGLACLLLANKLTDNKRIAVDWRVFPSSEIGETQLMICRRLGFRLTPASYVDLLDGLLAAWNRFAHRKNLWVYSLSNANQMSDQLDCRFFYEFADLAHLLLRSFDFLIGDLVLQIFKMGLNQDYNSHLPEPKPIEDEVLISFWNNPEEGLLIMEDFQDIFQTFLKEFHIIHHINSELEAYVTSFLLEGFTCSQTSCTNPSYLQTHNPNWLPLCRLLLSPRRNHRKSSSETTS